MYVVRHIKTPGKTTDVDGDPPEKPSSACAMRALFLEVGHQWESLQQKLVEPSDEEHQKATTRFHVTRDPDGLTSASD